MAKRQASSGVCSRGVQEQIPGVVWLLRPQQLEHFLHFLDPEGRSQKASLVVVVVVVVVAVVVSSLKISKAFLIRSEAQRNFAHAFMLTMPTDVPSQIFHLLSN